MLDERLGVAEMMMKYGGGFVRALGKALVKADYHNTQRIRTAFPDYWKQYMDMAESEVEQ